MLSHNIEYFIYGYEFHTQSQACTHTHRLLVAQFFFFIFPKSYLFLTELFLKYICQVF